MAAGTGKGGPRCGRNMTAAFNGLDALEFRPCEINHNTKTNTSGEDANS